MDATRTKALRAGLVFSILIVGFASVVAGYSWFALDKQAMSMQSFALGMNVVGLATLWIMWKGIARLLLPHGPIVLLPTALLVAAGFVAAIVQTVYSSNTGDYDRPFSGPFVGFLIILSAVSLFMYGFMRYLTRAYPGTHEPGDYVIEALNTKTSAGMTPSFPTREALSEHISQSPGRATRNWIWLEYSVARATVQGQYHGQPPSELQADWNYLVRELYPRTKANQRLTIIIGVISLCLALSFSWFSWEFDDYFFAIAIPAGTALALVIWYFRTVGFSSDPMTVLAREVEAASSLPGAERWSRLLAIAQDDPNTISA